MPYKIRLATLADASVIVHHRHAMFAEMDLKGDYEVADREFAQWLPQAMTNQLYFGWVIETETGEIIAGGGLMLLSWPPSPKDLSHQRAYIFNIYTEPPHRRNGLARQLMETMQHWCRERGINTISLHASEFGRPLYESIGYRPTTEMSLLLWSLETLSNALSNL